MSKFFAFLMTMLALTGIFSYAITSSAAEYNKSPCEFTPYEPPPNNSRRHPDNQLKDRSGKIA